ncbi:hypothetical protein POJ06DRAFT_278600 [Lipomyces tetrasporus]|uniref:SnoaL-like domain-containing protein n=1 Tax=Lipomyces tetrasporus TaxID=54092 RepID=A0AAD7QKS5_9ASCO|nr:uncharacterized protein POJ06DRAFT_278600 [Lipomyces tetrasporus]KAJ8097092.1 hypothetical protein POJ06DRAFT_278600 [Lipomyces tetrasporus]
MSSIEEQNKAMVAEYFEHYWGKANLDIVDKLCSDDFVINYSMQGPWKGKEAAKSMLSEFKEAFPNISFRAYQHPLIAEGPYVVGRWIGGGNPNTGKEMYFSDTTIFTLRDGKIVDETGEEGALTALQQLGLVQGPNPGKEVRYQLE